MNDTPSRSLAADTLFGGERTLIRFKDSKTPPKYMQVRALPLRLMRDLAESIEDEGRLVALYLDIELGDTDALHPDSVTEALRIGDEINLRPFVEGRERIKARLLRFALALNGPSSDGNQVTRGLAGATP